MNYPHKTKGLVCAFLVFFIWGFSLLASTVAQESTDPVVFLMYRFVLSAIIMLVPVLLGRKKMKITGKKLLCILALGATEPVIYFPCEQYALMYTNSSFLGIMLAVIPVVTMLMGTLLLSERPSGLQWLFSFVSISGVVALTLITGSSGAGTIGLKGIVFSILAVFTGSLYGIVVKLISPYTDSYDRTLGTVVMGAVFFTGWSFIRHGADVSVIVFPVRALSFDLAVMYVAVFGSVIGYTLLNVAYDHAPTANVVAFCNMQTVLAVICGVIFLNEPFSLSAGAAMLVVLIGIWGVQRFENKKTQAR